LNTFRINSPQQHLGLREHRFGEQEQMNMAFHSKRRTYENRVWFGEEQHKNTGNQSGKKNIPN